MLKRENTRSSKSRDLGGRSIHLQVWGVGWGWRGIGMIRHWALWKVVEEKTGNPVGTKFRSTLNAKGGSSCLLSEKM